MLEFIGLCAIIFVVVKWFPELMMFSLKALIVFVGLYFLLGTLAWIFGASFVFHMMIPGAGL